MFLFGGAERQEVLSTLDRILEPPEKLLQVVAALDEIDLRGVDYQKVRGGIAEKEMLVGARDLLDVFERDLRLLARSPFCDAGEQDFRLGLQVNNQVGSGEIGGKELVVALVELEFLVVEIEIGENAVFFEEKVGEDEARRFGGQAFAKMLLPLDQKIHLGAECGSWLGFVEIGKKRIVFAIVHAARVEAFGKDACEGGLADAQWTFDGDEARRLRAALRNERALGGQGVVAWHR